MKKQTIGERIIALEKKVSRLESLVLLMVFFSILAMLVLFGASELFGAQPRVLQEAVTDGGGWKIELADYGEPTHFELWQTRLSPPGPRIRISKPTTGQGWDVATGFVVIQGPRTWRAVYELDQIAQGIHDLRAVDLDNGSPELVDDLVVPGYVRFGKDKVVFGSEAQAGGAVRWWLSDTHGSNVLVIFADGFENGTSGRWK